MGKQKKLLLVIDSNSLIHRAYHALPPLTTKKGELVNAVYGFLLVFLRAIKEFQPDYIAAAFDFPAPTFRHQKFKEYKAKRPPAPEELYSQIPKAKEVLEAFDVPVFEEKGFEADDIIGTIVSKAPKKQIVPEVETIVLSGDLDTLQLVDPKTKVYALKRGVKDIILYDEKSVKEKFQGLKPSQLLDFKALRGDPSDNIPGVTGIGEKTATELLLEFKSLENLYKEIEDGSERAKKMKPKTKETLLKYKEQAFLSKALAEIEKNTPIDFNLEKCRWAKHEKGKAAEALKRFEFFSLIPRLSDLDRKKSKEKKASGEKKDKLVRENLRLC
jgi:DNA polymerase-1